MIRLYTIGFTQKTAERFFSLLREHEISCLVDIRLNPSGQLSGFAKQADLPFFLDRLAGCDYRHMPQLAPTSEVLSTYRADRNWERYEEQFERLMDDRNIPSSLDPDPFRGGSPCLLCSEASPERCHRRLVAERFARAWSGVQVMHLT